MKIRGYSFLFVFILLFALVALCKPAEKEINNDQVREKIIEKMKMKEGMEKDIKKMESLADEIMEDNEKLSRYFKNGDFVDIAELYKERSAILVTHEYKKIPGKSSGAFWKSVWTEGAELKFKTVNVYLSDVIGKKTVQVFEADPKGQKILKERTYDTIAFVIQEFHVIIKKEGSILHNITGEENRSYIHQDGCPWKY